jgi:TolB-like protein
MLALCFLCMSVAASTAGIPVAVFPFQELGEGRNDANLYFSGILAQRLVNSGNEIIGLDTVIDFMSNNRIRTVGYLETLNISQVRRDLGAAFVLLGTVSQRKEKPEPSMGLTLNLVRTSDARTVWTYVGSVSTGEERRVLGIGEPQSTNELQYLLLDEIVEQWPWQIINDAQQARSINIDTALLEPKHVRPGDEVHGRVRFRGSWSAEQTPRVYFRADDQLYPATASADGIYFEATWIAGEENGRIPVNLFLKWPHYDRTETLLMGDYLIDGTPPIFELDFRGTKLLEGVPVFTGKLVIVPRMIVRKAISRWRLAFYYSNEENDSVGEMDGIGNLPRSFTWAGPSKLSYGDGFYKVVLEAWDMAGNVASASRVVELKKGLPQVDLSLDRSGEEMIIDLEYDGKVPLRYWRLEMWTREGKILTQSEGKDLPVKIEVGLPGSDQDQEIRGILFYQDVFGAKVSRKVQELLPDFKKKTKKKSPAGISESWVDEF